MTIVYAVLGHSDLPQVDPESSERLKQLSISRKVPEIVHILAYLCLNDIITEYIYRSLRYMFVRGTNFRKGGQIPRKFGPAGRG